MEENALQKERQEEVFVEEATEEVHQKNEEWT
jgi:hypothetical protein